MNRKRRLTGRARLRAIIELACLGLLVASAGLSAQGPGELQLGLRLDSVSSVQWSRGRIYTEGLGRNVLETSVKRIDAVWPGSTKGSFVVFSDQGVGVLLGKDIVSAGPRLEPGALIRSSRLDALWVSIPSARTGSTRETRFVEWRSAVLSRELARVPASVLDFDVDASGRLLYLTDAHRIFLLAGPDAPAAEVVLPAGFSKPERIFIDAAGEQIVVYGGGALRRFQTKTRQWEDITFDVRRQALVRHVASRRVLVEDKFDP